MAAATQRRMLVPVIEPNQWYWAREVCEDMKLSRESIAQVKRSHPHHVISTRRGDIVRGEAVLDFLRRRTAERRKAKAASEPGN